MLCAELLQQYRGALEKCRAVQADYEAHQEYLQSPEMRQKEHELKEQRKELQDIEKKLGMLGQSCLKCSHCVGLAS